MKSARVFALALALLVPLSFADAKPASAVASVSVGFFYDSLSPHGNWITSANFGYVWQPTHTYAGWRPYTNGRWIYSNVGWTFASNDSWGWATDHYGRWYYDPYYGWVWVPGYEWAPAWVSFYEGPGYIGWAPLPPTFSLTVGYRSPYYVDQRAYNFVDSRYFLSSSVGRYVQPISQNNLIVRNVRDVSRFERVGNFAVNRGLALDRVERATKSRVRTLQLVEQVNTRAARSEIRGDSIAVFRPHVVKASRSERPAKVMNGRPAKYDAKESRKDWTEREAAPRASRPEPPSSRSVSPPSSRSQHEPARVEQRPSNDNSRSKATVDRNEERGKSSRSSVSSSAGRGRESTAVRQEASKQQRPSASPQVRKEVERKPTASQERKVSAPAQRKQVAPQEKARSERPEHGKSATASSASERDRQLSQKSSQVDVRKSAPTASKSVDKADKGKPSGRGKATTSKKRASNDRKPPHGG